MPPAAYWAEQGKMNIWGVILAGGTGSTFGSSLCYAFTYYAGRPFVQRWGKFFLLPPARLELAEATFRRQLARAAGNDGAGPVRYRAGTLLGDVLLAKGERAAALVRAAALSPAGQAQWLDLQPGLHVLLLPF